MSKSLSSIEGVDEQLAKAIECPICAQVLAEPKTLHCGHTFCASCILKMWSKKASNRYDTVDKQGAPLICPLCRQPSQLSGNILPTNTALQSIVYRLIEQQQNAVPCTSCGQQVIYAAQAFCETCFEQSGDFTLLCFSCACGIHAKAGHTVVQRAKTEGHLQSEVLPKLYELSEKAKWMANDAARSAKSAASFLTDTTFLNEAVQTFGKTARKLESLSYCTKSFATENVHAMEQLFGRFKQVVEDFDNFLGSTVASIGKFQERATKRFFEPDAASSYSNSNNNGVAVGSEIRIADDEPPKNTSERVAAKFFPKHDEIAASESGMDETEEELNQPLYLVEKFAEVNLRKDVLQGLKDKGISEPTSLQKHLLCPCITGRNVIVEASKGSGKLIAACLTVLNEVNLKLPHVQALIFVPQREMANTVCALLNELAKNKNFVCYGLSSKDQSYLESFKATPTIHIVVGCADRIVNLVRNHNLSVVHVKVLIYYNAEVIVPMSLMRDNSRVLKWMTANFQTVMMFTSLSIKHFTVSKQFVKNPYVFWKGTQCISGAGEEARSTLK